MSTTTTTTTAPVITLPEGFEIKATAQVNRTTILLGFAPVSGMWATWKYNNILTDAHYFCPNCNHPERRAWEDFRARGRELAT